MDGFREKKDAAGIEGRIWCVCVCVWERVGGTEGGNHSAIKALSLGPVFMAAAPMRRGRGEEGTEGQEERRAQIRILIAMIITVCHPIHTFYTCGKCRWVS